MLEGSFAPLKRLTQKIVGLKGESKALEDRLEKAEIEAALNQQAALEMQRALEEEIAFQKEAQNALGRHFVGAQSGYNDLMMLFESSRAENSQQFVDLKARLNESQAAQQKAENEVVSLKADLRKLTKNCHQLEKKAEALSAELKKAQSENKELREEVLQQASMIEELLKLQEDGQLRNQALLKENEMLRTRLEMAERSVAVLMEP